MTTITITKLDGTRYPTALETAFFRKLQHELLDIGKQLDQSSFTDKTTLDLRDWHKRFVDALRSKNRDIQLLLEENIAALQIILTDPLTATVIEDQVVLGSDGIIYGVKALKIREACLLAESGDTEKLKEVIAPEMIASFIGLDRDTRVQYSKRSPLNPLESTFFTTQPHTLISSLLTWLTSYNKRLSIEKIDNAYEWLMQNPHIVVRDDSIEYMTSLYKGIAKVQAMIEAGFSTDSLRTVQHLTLIKRDEEKLIEAFAEIENILSASDRDELFYQMRELEAKVIQFSHLVQQEISPAAASALYRRLKIELQEIGKALESSPLQDETTISLRDWHQEFTRCLRKNKDIGAVLGEFIGVLDDILTDPLTNEVVGNRPLQGSDGGLYGFEALAIFKACLLAEGEDIEKLKEVIVPEALATFDGASREEKVLYSERSPVDMQNPAFFMTRPHPIASMMLAWLSGHGARPSTHKIDTLYQWFIEHLPHRLNRSEILPRGSLEERMARKLEKSIEQRRRLAVADANFHRDLEKLQIFPEIIAQTQAEFDQKLVELTSSIMQQVEALEQSELKVYQALNREIRTLTQGVSKLTSDLSAAKQQCESIRTEIETLDAEQKQIKEGIERLKQEKKRRKKRARLRVIRAVCGVGIVIAVNYMLPPGVGATFTKDGLHIGWSF